MWLALKTQHLYLMKLHLCTHKYPRDPYSFPNFRALPDYFLCEITQVRAACSWKVGRFSGPAAVQTLSVCCLPCSENKLGPTFQVGFCHLSPRLQGYFPFPAHTKQIPPPAPGALQKGSCAWGNVPGSQGDPASVPSFKSCLAAWH